MNNQLIIMYDYDGTLAPGNIQEPMLIPTIMPEFKDCVGEFWKLTNAAATSDDLDGNCTYMMQIIESARNNNIILTEEFLAECGSYSTFFPGVESWFQRINKYATSKGIDVKHYIISSGNYELIKGTKIAKYFEEIFACRFKFNGNPRQAVGVGRSVTNNAKVNYIDTIRTPLEYRNLYNIKDELKIPYQNMIYIGDGTTDIPAMVDMINGGGVSYAIYSTNSDKETKALKFVDEKIVKGVFCSDTCYKPNSGLQKTIYSIINHIKNINDESIPVQLNIFDLMDMKDN